MSVNLRIMIFLVALVLYCVVFTIFKRGRIPLKYSLVWLIPATLILFIAIIPDVLWKFTKMLGFQTTSNMVIGILFIILFFICISLTVIVSGQKTKITLLIQEISLLKEKNEKDITNE